MSKPYNFIPFLETKYTEMNLDNCRLKGKIDLEIKVLNAIHISEDSYDMNEDETLYKKFYTIGDNYAVPGTSLKGMVRNLAEMVSNSCISATKEEQRFLPKGKEKSCGFLQKCIICDIFGAMGKRSKIKFSNFVCNKNSGAVDIIGLPALRPPNVKVSSIYLESGVLRGYKIYNHGIESILKKGEHNCECLMKNSTFKGSVLYEDLDEEELRLLCYSLGLAGDFNHKLGYGKPAYYGSIEIIAKDNKYVQYAKDYIVECPDDIKKNIGLLSKIYSFKNAKKTPDYEGLVY
ncbi:RAMP superfamily CRISPR-associated protein [Clostridium sp. YIM B02555]|uniref:RAMP superfamily CRISPR-associated protein n=1 Tax=Clostridium sp. YIM B02555 TaxID=2911968 RepID=UPI001EEF1936|nr:RAMP superfamily CRISPR-associated protein [Clostridium sp. YIM B02555]